MYGCDEWDTGALLELAGAGYPREIYPLERSIIGTNSLRIVQDDCCDGGEEGPGG